MTEEYLYRFGLGLLLLSAAACGPRVVISTGTTIGLKATPGDGYTRPPQVTLGYKRAELALVPTKGVKATAANDAYSTLAAIHFDTQWFGKTELESFLVTGIAAREIQGVRTAGNSRAPTSKEFQTAFALATLGPVSDTLQARREALIAQWGELSDGQAQRVLDIGELGAAAGKTAKESLQDRILDAQDEASLMKLESAFNRIR